MPGFLSKLKNKKDLKINFAKRSAGPIRPSVLENPFVAEEQSVEFTVTFLTGVYKLTHPDYTYYYYANVSENTFILDGVEQDITNIALFGNPYTYNQLTLTKENITEDLTFVTTEILNYTNTYAGTYDILNYLLENTETIQTKTDISGAIAIVKTSEAGTLNIEHLLPVIKSVLVDTLSEFGETPYPLAESTDNFAHYISNSTDVLSAFINNIGKFIFINGGYTNFNNVFTYGGSSFFDSGIYDGNTKLIAEKLRDENVSVLDQKKLILCFLLFTNSFAITPVSNDSFKKNIIFYFNDIQAFTTTNISKINYFNYYVLLYANSDGNNQIGGLISYFQSTITKCSTEVVLQSILTILTLFADFNMLPTVDNFPDFVYSEIGVVFEDYYSYIQEEGLSYSIIDNEFFLVLGMLPFTLYAAYTLIEETPCLLEGTLVKTPEGDKRIETLKEGDYIQSQNNKICKITKVGKWPCFYKDRKISQIVYKVPAGSMNNKTDLFISHHHRISNGFRLLPPHALGFQIATESEITNNGKYTLYHLKIEQGLINYLVVNGGTRVESWL